MIQPTDVLLTAAALALLNAACSINIQRVSASGHAQKANNYSSNIHSSNVNSSIITPEHSRTNRIGLLEGYNQGYNKSNNHDGRTKEFNYENNELLHSIQSNNIDDVDSESQRLPSASENRQQQPITNIDNSKNNNVDTLAGRFHNKTRHFLTNIKKNLNSQRQHNSKNKNSTQKSLKPINNSNNNNYATDNSISNDAANVQPNLYSYYANKDKINDGTNQSASLGTNNNDDHHFKVVGQQDGVGVTGREIQVSLRQANTHATNRGNITGKSKSPQGTASSINNSSSGKPTNNHSLFLLNYQPPLPNQPPVDNPSVGQSELGASEQQQPPPSTLFPNNQINNNNNRQLFSNNNNNNLQQQQPLRQPFNLGILQGQQQSPSQFPNQQQQQQQFQQPQQHQNPFLGPLQLLTAPLQAAAPFLPQLQTNQYIPQNNQQNLNNNHINSNNNLANRQTYPATTANGKATSHLGNNNRLGNTQQHQQNLYGNGQSNPTNQIANSPTPPLQSLYQQLPLYQALLAARQRQMALLAERHRQQQLIQNAQSRGANGNNQGFNNQQVNNINGNNQFNSNANHLVQGNRQQQQQRRPNSNNILDQVFDDNSRPNGNNNNNNYNSNNNNLVNNNPNQPISSQNGDNQKNNLNQFNQRSKNNNQANSNSDEPQVKFDDDVNNGSGKGTTDSNGSNDEGDDNGGGGGQEDQGNQGDGDAKEEDPDIKNFQNLAGNGDFPGDVFPPGILNDNDIKEIRKQQEEQSRKQDEEERRKQEDAQQQQNSQEQEQPRQQQESPNHNQQLNSFNNQLQQPNTVGGLQQFNQQNPIGVNNGLSNNQQNGYPENVPLNPAGYGQNNIDNNRGVPPLQNGFAQNIPFQNGLNQQQNPNQPNLSANHNSNVENGSLNNNNQNEAPQNENNNEENPPEGESNETEGGENDDQSEEQPEQDQPTSAALSANKLKPNQVVAKASKPSIAHVAGVEYSAK